MTICVWCGFDRLEKEAELCPVCGQTPDSDSVTLVVTEAPGTTMVRPEGNTPAEVQRVFAGRYRIEATMGRGGMGAVFRVVDERTSATYALKVLHASAERGRDVVKRFEREAELLRRIAHPSVPKIHDFGIAGESMYLITDFIDGMNLRDALNVHGVFPLREVTRIGAAVADGLNSAHEHGIVHRDVKPHNVMITRDREVRLIDFGIARDAGLNATTITATATMMGTPHYMSPEQFVGSRVDARTDIYSLGVLLFELATGRLPFSAETHTELAIKHTTEPPPQPRSLRPEIPMLLNRVILKCLEKNPADRYPTAGELAAELRRSGEAKRNVTRTRFGDFIVDEDTGEGWGLVIASPREKPAWSAGMTLHRGGSYFHLVRVDFDATYPAPYVYRFAFSPETAAIRRFADYDDPAQHSTPAPSLLSKWFGPKPR